jgi:hypothetical protein
VKIIAMKNFQCKFFLAKKLPFLRKKKLGGKKERKKKKLVTYLHACGWLLLECFFPLELHFPKNYK